MNISLFKRLAANLIVLGSVIFLPWFISAILVVIFYFVFDRYYEGVIAGFLMDSLYGIPRSAFYGFEGIATLASGFAFLMSLYIKSVVRYYR